MLEDPGTGIQVRLTLQLETWCKYPTRQFAAIPNTCTCTPNTYLHQSIVTHWSSFCCCANGGTSRAGRRLRAARLRRFASIRTPFNPMAHSGIDFAPQSPIPPLYRCLRWLFTAFLARVALSTVGFWWIDVDTVSKKRSYASTFPPPM